MWAPLSLFVLAGAWISRQIARARIHLLRQLTQYLRTRRAEDRPQVQGRDAWSRALRELTAEADLSVHDLRWQPAEVEVDAVVAANDAPAQSKVA